MSRVILYLRSSAVWGGAERQLLVLAQMAAAQDWQPHLAVLYRSPKRENEMTAAPSQPFLHPLVHKARAMGIPAFQIEDASPFGWHTLSQLSQIIDRLQPAIMHSYDYKTDVLAAWFGARRHLPLIATANGYVASDAKLELYEKLDRLVLRFFDQVIAVSGAVKQELLASGLPNTRVRIVHNALVAAVAGNATALRRGWGVPDQAGLVSSVGRLSPEKGHRTFVEAAGQVLAARPGTHFWLVGGGDLDTSLRSQVAGCGLEGAFHFLGQQADASAAMLASDMVVLPSYREAFGVVLLEAMSLGKAVVASDVGGIPEIVQHERSGLLVRPGDAVGLANSIVRLIDQPNLRYRLGAYGQQDVASRFSAAGMVRQVLDLYADLVTSHT